MLEALAGAVAPPSGIDERVIGSVVDDAEFTIVELDPPAPLLLALAATGLEVSAMSFNGGRCSSQLERSLAIDHGHARGFRARVHDAAAGALFSAFRHAGAGGSLGVAAHGGVQLNVPASAVPPATTVTVTGSRSHNIPRVNRPTTSQSPGLTT